MVAGRWQLTVATGCRTSHTWLAEVSKDSLFPGERVLQCCESAGAS